MVTQFKKLLFFYLILSSWNTLHSADWWKSYITQPAQRTYAWTKKNPTATALIAVGAGVSSLAYLRYRLHCNALETLRKELQEHIHALKQHPNSPIIQHYEPKSSEILHNTTSNVSLVSTPEPQHPSQPILEITDYHSRDTQETSSDDSSVVWTNSVITHQATLHADDFIQNIPPADTSSSNNESIGSPDSTAHTMSWCTKTNTCTTTQQSESISENTNIYEQQQIASLRAECSVIFEKYLQQIQSYITKSRQAPRNNHMQKTFTTLDKLKAYQCITLYFSLTHFGDNAQALKEQTLQQALNYYIARICNNENDKAEKFIAYIWQSYQNMRTSIQATINRHGMFSNNDVPDYAAFYKTVKQHLYKRYAEWKSACGSPTMQTTVCLQTLYRLLSITLSLLNPDIICCNTQESAQTKIHDALQKSKHMIDNLYPAPRNTGIPAVQHLTSLVSFMPKMTIY